MDTTIFQTPRTLARPWTTDDAPAAFDIYSNAEVIQFLGSGTQKPVESVEAMRQRIEKWHEFNAATPGLGRWAIIDRALNRAVGTILLKDLDGSEYIEVGWHLGRDHWGKGYATEAGRGAIDYGFDRINLSRIVAVVNPANTRSLAVAHRLGMKHVGHGQYYNVDLQMFEVSCQQWRARCSENLEGKAGG